jgi:hypothetical protein
MRFGKRKARSPSAITMLLRIEDSSDSWKIVNKSWRFSSLGKGGGREREREREISRTHTHANHHHGEEKHTRAT